MRHDIRFLALQIALSGACSACGPRQAPSRRSGSGSQDAKVASSPSSTPSSTPSPTPAPHQAPAPSPAPVLTPIPAPTPNPSSNSGRIPVGTIYGVTIDTIDQIATTIDSLKALPKHMTTRVVFDELIPASTYVAAVSALSAESYVMGEILDSSAVKQYTTASYLTRTTEYLDALGSQVDIWEIGNEINGEWLGTSADVAEKAIGAYDLVKARGKTAELTLYYNQDCWAQADHEMFAWAKANIPDRMKQGLDYVLVSYYEDDCNGLRPNWQNVFDQLGQIFPHSKIGIGEMGTKIAANKRDLLTRYYTMKINHPRFIGGNFYWYFHQDMVPKNTSLWSDFFHILSGL